MRKLTTFTALALLMAGSAAALADGLPSLKDTPVAPPPSPWDVAFGGGIASDYVFRGISQSDRWPSANAYTELRYNVNPSLQLYSAIGAYSISFPNDAAAEVDLYFGIRPTFDKLTFDFGGQYYWYPGGQLYSGAVVPGSPLGTPNANCTNGFVGANDSCNALEADLSFWEVYGKAAYAFTDTFTLGSGVFYAPSWLSTGADGLYANLTAKYVLPGGWLPSSDYGAFISGEYGHYSFGETNDFYFNTDLPDYNTWNVGLSFTYKVFTLDFRYYDTDLSESQCNVLTGDQTARYSAGNVTSLNPSGLGSNWCSEAFVAKLSFDLTASTNLK